GHEHETNSASKPIHAIDHIDKVGHAHQPKNREHKSPIAQWTVCPENGILKLMIPMPKKHTHEAIRTCTSNFRFAPSGFKSSHIPSPNMPREALTKTSRSCGLLCPGKNQVMMSSRTPNAATSAMPPRRGTDPN